MVIDQWISLRRQRRRLRSGTYVLCLAASPSIPTRSPFCREEPSAESHSIWQALGMAHSQWLTSAMILKLFPPSDLDKSSVELMLPSLPESVRAGLSSETTFLPSQSSSVADNTIPQAG